MAGKGLHYVLKFKKLFLFSNKKNLVIRAGIRIMLVRKQTGNTDQTAFEKQSDQGQPCSS